MEKLKSLWARWKVQISFVAGALVVSTTMGTCSFEPTVTPAATGTETTSTTTTDGVVANETIVVTPSTTTTTDGSTTTNSGE
mgnify:FL=1